MADPDGLTTVIVSDRLVIAINTQAQIQSDRRIDVGTRERQSIGNNSAVNEYYMMTDRTCPFGIQLRGYIRNSKGLIRP